MFGIWLFLLISFQGYKASVTHNVTCMVINLDYVNCSWSEQGSPDMNSTFFHNKFNTQKNHMEECSTYLLEQGYVVGCRLDYERAARFRTLITKLVFQNKTYEQKHDLKDRVKLYPPANLSLEMINNTQLNLYWNYSKYSHCAESEVRFRINTNDWKSLRPRQEQMYSVPFPSNSNTYEFQENNNTDVE
ncbi:hypothetical protein DPEC_G00236310 [Dallia pectoralis]|uniref:Uncharacterized protein n=1 Tax=Dallia pectoralis TaxID=75939 RepID=A0ACC2FYP3_DALPE|nr:hypothetical protein DPEC_G00236310 [Dallia pectoralis]